MASVDEAYEALRLVEDYDDPFWEVPGQPDMTLYPAEGLMYDVTGCSLTLDEAEESAVAILALVRKGRELQR